MQWESDGSRIEIGPDAEVMQIEIRPWTRQERLDWYRTGRPPQPRPRWWDKEVIARHPELGDLDRRFDNLYGGGFE